MKIRVPLAVALLLVTAGTAVAKEVVARERSTSAYALVPAGAVVIENPFGNVEVIGTDEAVLSITAEKLVRGVDREALADGRRLTQTAVLGDERVRTIRTLMPLVRDGRWSSSVNYVVRVPRTADIKIGSNSSERIRVTELGGSVMVRNLNGAVVLDRVNGPVLVDSVNGSITMNAPSRIVSNANLSTINGSIEVRAPADARFQWEGEVIKGDVRTNFQPQMRFSGRSFRGLVNAPGDATIRTQTFAGNVFILKSGSEGASAQSIRPRFTAPPNVQAPRTVVPRNLQQPMVQDIIWETTLGNIAIGEVRGSAKISTGAGEVQLGSVLGRCQVTSLGGPLSLGDIFGPLTARTEGGDVLVQSARQGGTITTGGGMIRLLYSGGPTRLHSGGGDIIVRQATAPVIAETRSGDITITVDPSLKSEKITARTAKGNVVLNIAPGFAADVEAVILTTDPSVNTIRSDFPGLTIQREQVDGKSRIRAVGKINGGGERVELSAEDGRIQITAVSVPEVGSVTRR